MKKFLSAVVFAICILSVSFCSADTYKNNPNYVYVTMNHGENYYLYLPSLNVQEYNPPHYKIKVKFVCVGDEYRNYSAREVYVVRRYNWYTKESFWLTKEGNWQKDDVHSEASNSYYAKKIANAIFRAAYGMNFYN